MILKEIIQKLNIFQDCRRYNLSLWQCPSFLFFMMGIVIILAIIITYQIGTHYIENPEIVALIVLVIVVILLIINFSITKSFEALAETNRMKSEFINIASHQLRSPLVNLKWAIDFLVSGRDKTSPKKQSEYLNILKENSLRMEKLISDLLIVSRIETPDFSLRKQKISLEEITKKIILRFRSFVEASNIQLNYQIEDNLPQVVADPEKIKIVIENFLSNAVRYVPISSVAGEKKKREVNVELRKKGKSVCFKVQDNGIGIPKDEQKYIFQKFFRAKNALKCQTQGTGLGLCITKSIIEKSRGKIGFKSKEGEGSTFWFTLPIN